MCYIRSPVIFFVLFVIFQQKKQSQPRGLPLICGSQDYHKKLPVPHPVRGKKLFSGERVGAFG
jgi:hypothetical protein